MDRLIEDLQAQYYPYKANKENYYVQLAVRPIQFWEIVMPEPELDSVMKMIWNTNANAANHGSNSKFKYPMAMIRKGLGVQKIPTFDEKLPKRVTSQHEIKDVACYPIGIKPDNYKNGNEEL